MQGISDAVDIHSDLAQSLLLVQCVSWFHQLLIILDMQISGHTFQRRAQSRDIINCHLVQVVSEEIPDPQFLVLANTRIPETKQVELWGM